MSSTATISSLKELSDEKLILQYQSSKDQNYLAIAYTRYTDLLYGVCFNYLNDQEKARDAIMNIYQELVSKVPLYPIQNFKSWVYSVAKNHCLMQLRKEKKAIIISFEAAHIQENIENPIDEILEKEASLSKMHACIEKLPIDQKRTISLFYLENKCYNEIKEITGLEWNTIRSHIQNGRRNLKICMKNK